MQDQNIIMRTLKLICLSLLAVTVALVGAAGQPSSTNINPALLYYQAFLVAPAPLPQSEWDYLASKEGWEQPLPERFAEILGGYDNQFRLARQAARATVPCDWGTDLSAGPATLLPCLAPAKSVAVMAGLRVTWDLQHGRQADARDDLLATFTLARNLSRDGTLVSTLVQRAMEAIACYAVAQNFGRFSPETLKQLADGLEATPARGTVAACVPMEKVLFGDWLLGRIGELRQANPGDEAKVMSGIHGLLEGALGEAAETSAALRSDSADPKWWESLTQAAGGTSDGIIRLVRELEPVSQKLAVLLALPYAEYVTQVKPFEAEVQQSRNPLISRIVPAWLNSRTKEFRVQVMLAMVRAGVEYKLHGEQGLQSVTDPCGQGPFAFERFVFQGVDRGFELKSPFYPGSFQAVLIFVEKEGPTFLVDGPRAGQARSNP